ncbi:MAG: site-2 protease family protein, partial [Candidatus Shapirobacteria bacterium]
MDLIIFIVALSILVLVHELGHFFAARKNGVRVEEFGLGLPPRIIGKKIGDTIYSINWLPIGGFCKLYGEDGDGKGGNSFNHKKPWQKLIIVLGGVFMNLVLAILIFSVVYTILGVPTETNKVKIIGIAKNSPAE